MTHIYNGNFMKQLLIDPVILSAVTLTQPFVMVQRHPLWPHPLALMHLLWKHYFQSCELIQYNCWDHMNMGVLLYNICKWCFSQNLSLDVVRVLFYLSIRSDIILLQINNYILEISYRFLDFVSHLAPSMSNILKCNEHQECLKTAKMGYFPMKMHDFPSIFVKSYYQQHITMEWDVPHLQHIQL